MKMDPQIFSKVGKLLVKSKQILIFLPVNPSVDVTAAGLALYFSLKASGKRAAIVCSEPIPVALNRLIGVDKIQNQIGGQNLVISFEYLEDSIEKVSYNINNGKFNLVIQPKEGYPPLDYQKLSYKYSGAVADMLIIIGCQRPEEVGRLYLEEKKLFAETESLNLDISRFNSGYGKTNFIDPQSSSCSELAGLVIKNLNMTVNPDIATNILAGMETATNNFNFRTRAETFDLIAWAMHAGGRRLQMQPVSSPQVLKKKPFSYPSSSEMSGQDPTFSGATYQPINIPLPSYYFPQANYSSANSQTSASLAEDSGVTSNLPPFTFENKPSSSKAFSGETGGSVVNQAGKQVVKSAVPPKDTVEESEPAPPDWLKPKIYKGSSQV